jgi:hypothetical protein
MPNTETMETPAPPDYRPVGGHTDPGDPHAPIIVVVGIVGTVLVFVLIVALQALFPGAPAQAPAAADQGEPRQLTQLRTEQLETINRYGWKDQAKGIVTIPIDRAMELTVRDLAAGAAPTSQPAGSAPASRAASAAPGRRG